MTLILVVLLLVVVLGGGFGYSRYGVAGGLGPVGILLVVLAVLFLTGNLRL